MNSMHIVWPVIFSTNLLFQFNVILLNEIGRSQAQASTCACDLTQNACDPNCCCDSECTASDKTAFTYCKNVDLNKDDRVCVSDQIIHFANVKYKGSKSGASLFCIYTDNYVARNIYTSVQTATTVSRFNELLSTYGKTSFIPSPLPTKTYLPTSKYKYGDAVLLLFESNVQGYLALPKPSVGSSRCDDQNPAGFMKDEASKCSRYITDLPSQCMNDKSLDALSYYTGFKFIPGPSFLAKGVVFQQENVTVTTTVVQPTSILATVSASTKPLASNSSASISLNTPAPSAGSNKTSNGTYTKTATKVVFTLASYNDPGLVNATLVQPIVCQTSTGIQGSCSFDTPPKPTYNFNNNTCSNVLLKASYTVFYDENSSGLNISSVNVNLILGDVSSTIQSFNQEFSIKFQKVGTQSTFARSGNPGYINRRYILAGTLQINMQLKKEAIVLNKDPNQWLTIFKSSSSNLCGTSSQRTSVKFGINMRSGCFISVKRVMTTGECILLQNNIYNSLLGAFPTHVAMYGNSPVTNTADWVQILNTKPLTAPAALNGQCTNIVLGVHFEILHSKTGYLGNPQSRIVGFNVKYDSPKAISFHCTGAFCQPGSSSLQTQQVEVTQSVSFVDVSTTPEAQMKPKPNFEAKAPYDFFYPFL